MTVTGFSRPGRCQKGVSLFFIIVNIGVLHNLKDRALSQNFLYVNDNIIWSFDSPVWFSVMILTDLFLFGRRPTYDLMIS